ncbi:MAG: hypothetical protein MI919_29170, partial [Holophagales bacterium]|nr:hypothetical protein [Holophagales bacterium]
MAAEADAGAPELEEGYYARNFEVVARTVAERYGDLLSTEEAGLIESFEGASEDAKRLFVRLASRKGPLFRRDLLDYPEIPGLDAAVGELRGLGLLDLGEGASAAELLELMRMPELRRLAQEPSQGRGDARGPGHLGRPRRPELLAHLFESRPGDELAAAVHERYPVLRPLGIEILRVLRLLFFGNLHQTWSELVVRDLGIVRFEAVELRRDLRLFPDRRSVDQVLELGLTRERVADLVREGELDAAVGLARRVATRAGDWHPLAQRHADRLLVRVGRELERAGRGASALELYGGAASPPARERCCRVLERIGRPEEALELARGIRAEPRDETEAYFAPAFVHRLERKLGLRSDPYHRRRRPRAELRLPPPDGSRRAPADAPRVTAMGDALGGSSVEWRVLQALEQQGREAIYSENWLWRSIFGLAFWEEIFAPVPGAFHHPFQSGPVDLFGPDFRRARGSALAARLGELRAWTELETRLWPVYEAKAGIANALVPWHEAFRSPLRSALGRLRGEPTAVICDRLSR